MYTALVMDQPTSGKPGCVSFVVCPRDIAAIINRKKCSSPITCVRKQQTQNAGFLFIAFTRGFNTSLKFQIKIIINERGLAKVLFCYALRI